MLPASHLISHGVPGHGPSVGKCVSGIMIQPCPSCNNCKRSQYVKLVPFSSSSKGTMSFICNANSSGHGRNPDFSRHNRQGFSRNKNMNNDDRDGIDRFEDTEVLSSKNRSAFISNSPPKFQSTATPGPREREIVEIFRKVQAQLRERAVEKDEKKVEDLQGHNKQNETVDSLLKLLRKHSVQHGKNTTSSRNNKDSVLDHQPEKNNSFIDDRTTKNPNGQVRYEAQTTRPSSNFQKRSPVTRFKYKPILTGEDSFTPGPFKRKEAVLEPESTPLTKTETRSEPEAESEAFDDVFDESSDDERSDIEDSADEINDSEEVDAVKKDDLSGMKLAELREVAKSRGVKGFSRLKKAELLELLTS